MLGKFKVWWFTWSNRKLWRNHMHRVCVFTLQSNCCQIAEDEDVRGWQLRLWSSCMSAIQSLYKGSGCIDRVGTTGQCFPLENLYNTIYDLRFATVAVIIKFTFRFRSTIALRCERGWKKRCEIVFTFASCTPFLQVSSVVKFLTAYTRCSLRPTVFYLGYALGPGSLSLLVFVRCPQLLQNGKYSGNTIDH